MVYVWGGIWLTLGIVGMVYQCKQKSKADSQAEDKAVASNQDELKKNVL